MERDGCFRRPVHYLRKFLHALPLSLVYSDLSEAVDALPKEVEDGGLILQAQLLASNYCRSRIPEKQYGHDEKDSSRDHEVQIDLADVDYRHEDIGRPLYRLHQSVHEPLIDNPQIA
jgi:hypothetical protein